MANLQILRRCESDGNKRRQLQLFLAWSCFLTGSAAAQEGERAGSPIRVEYTVDELSPAGTVIGILADAYPHLRNFRVTAGSSKKAFAIDSASGSLIVRNPQALDFELRSVHVLTITADAESHTDDAFLDDFKASLLEEGASSGSLDRLTSVERTILVTVQIQDVPEPTPLSGDSVGNSSDPIVAELTQPLAIAAPETAPEVAMSVIDTPSVGTETVASSASVVSLPELIRIPEVQGVSELPPAATSSEVPTNGHTLAAPESHPTVPSAGSQASVTSLPDKTSTEQTAPSVGRDAVQGPVEGAVDGAVLVEAPADSNPSQMNAAVGILLILLLVAVAIITVLLRRASNARNETIRLKKEEEAENVQTATAIPEKTVEASETAQPLISSDVAIADQHGYETSDQPVAACVANARKKEEKATNGSNRDPESLFSDDYLLEPSHSRKPGDPAPTAASRQRDDYGCDDPGESPAQARHRVEQSMERHSRSSGEQLFGFQNEANQSSIATLAPVENLRAELCDLFAMQPSAPNASPPPVAEPTGASEPDAPAEAPQSDEAHQDSIARYLSDLLDRKKEESAAESLLVDRRKSGGKSDGAERRGERATAPERKPVKSYLESYMKDHGGHLSDEHGTSVRDTPTLPEVKPVPKMPAEPPVERTPVDVTSIREVMTSFRQVALRSVEHALALHRLQQAQGALAFRRILLFALLLITVFIVTANMLQAIHLYSLNWLMGVILVLCFTELCLRTQRLRHDRRELISRAATPQSDAELSVQDSPADGNPAAVAG